MDIFYRAGGFLAYYEICEKTNRNGWSVERDPQNRIGPYAHHGNQWVSYDDVENVRVKAKFMRDLNLGGGMIWALVNNNLLNIFLKMIGLF